jgi:hypothetical protein
VRVRVAIALGLTVVTALALPACSTDSSQTKSATSSAARVGTPANGAQQTAPLSSSSLEMLLLDEGDLGSGYTRRPERPAQHDDVTVLGCPALAKLGGNAATGGSLAFPRKAKASFTFGGSGGGVRGAVQRHRRQALERHRPNLRRHDRLPGVPGPDR